MEGADHIFEGDLRSDRKNKELKVSIYGADAIDFVQAAQLIFMHF